jgi:hypothetical protein
MIGRLSDDAIRACLSPTLRAVHAAPPGPWASGVVAQLIGLVEYAGRRGPDPSDERRARLVAALDSLAGNSLVSSHGTPEQRASSALVAAVRRDDANADADTDAVRATLRPILVGELDDELAETMPLLDGFRGVVRDA